MDEIVAMLRKGLEEAEVEDEESGAAPHAAEPVNVVEADAQAVEPVKEIKADAQALESVKELAADAQGEDPAEPTKTKDESSTDSN